MKQGLFVGLATLDCIYLSESVPQANQKLVALDYLTAAGGPATNAAVAFGQMGNQARVMSVFGRHSLSQIILQDLHDLAIKTIDLKPESLVSPSISSIVVTAATAERSIISLNALKSQGDSSQIPSDVLNNVDLILIDGHQMGISLTLAKLATAKQIPIVVDGGSWKPGFAKVLALADYVICSANFFPPQCSTTQDTLAYLRQLNIPQIAITQGEQPIQYLVQGKVQTIAVPQIKAVDTLGAGDIFHGAFCHYILQTDFPTALTQAAKIASQSCQYFGTRSWLGGTISN